MFSEKAPAGFALAAFPIFSSHNRPSFDLQRVVTHAKEIEGLSPPMVREGEGIIREEKACFIYLPVARFSVWEWLCGTVGHERNNLWPESCQPTSRT